MANFTKKDLGFINYSTTADGRDNPKYIGTLDRIKVDKTEEYEVIYFCNKFLEKYDIPQTKESFQNVERLLHHEDLRGEDNRENIINWIANSWHKNN
ncbi:hypothetical protein QLS91_09495 [Flavobacterium sp. LB2P84]|uniref:hypothetical protein n=1 Tax=Flavobacterium yafengii TaxID=3041253 RepID=UPI0024A87377|nr:hypothetical protein [Flavobacterium yafengii]MDI6033307.1 hypothetical protein [Flavobacterium yafengii]